MRVSFLSYEFLKGFVSQTTSARAAIYKPQSNTMRVLLIRATATFGTDIRYSGGVHTFRCIAETLASGHDVHVLRCASKAELLFSAMQHGCMPHLAYSQAAEGVALWSHNKITHHVALTDAEQSVQDQLSTALAGLGTADAGSTTQLNIPPTFQRLLEEAKWLVHGNRVQHQQQQHEQCVVLLDADGCQNCLSPTGPSLLEALTQTINPAQVVLLVQNIHFLPFGPYGTAMRTPGLHRAWSVVGKVACVSNFVAQYVVQHAEPLGLQRQRVRVVHCATWGAFGTGPFRDFGVAHAEQLPWQLPTQQLNSSDASNVSQQHQQRKPVIGCLKLTPEKGGYIFLQLAQRMPYCNFLGVCSDPALQQAAAVLALPNLRLIQPVADVDQLLQHMVIVLAPSVWQEAFGMVVVTAQLRGVPVIVGNQGGLAEAAQGASAAVVPVDPMLLPGDDTGCPSWKLREYQQQQSLDMWQSAIRQLLLSRQRYAACSKAGRDVTITLIEQQPVLLQQFMNWVTG